MHVSACLCQIHARSVIFTCTSLYYYVYLQLAHVHLSFPSTCRFFSCTRASSTLYGVMPPRKKSTGRPVAVSEPSDDQEALPHSDAAQSSLAAPSVSGMQSSSISGTNGRVLEDMSCTLDAKCAVCTGSATCDDGLARTSMECGVCGQKGCGQLALHDPRCTSFELRHLALHALWHVC